MCTGADGCTAGAGDDDASLAAQALVALVGLPASTSGFCRCALQASSCGSRHVAYPRSMLYVHMERGCAGTDTQMPVTV